MRHLQRIGRALGRSGWNPFAPALCASLIMAFSAVSCATPDPKALLRVSDVETYWILDPSRTDKRFLAPVVRFQVENISQETLLAVDATASFHRETIKDPWGSGFFRLTEGRKAVAPGAKVLVTMSSDARYTLEGAPETAFQNSSFKSVDVKFFLKVGRSTWADFGTAPVENVLGSKEARQVINHPQ
ncbi:MAG: hypothetical protein JJE39_09910 [Vicinamibacteria bacterium]|nr:hypothetical protein [Vicinamibacteria bacterium]